MEMELTPDEAEDVYRARAERAKQREIERKRNTPVSMIDVNNYNTASPEERERIHREVFSKAAAYSRGESID